MRTAAVMPTMLHYSASPSELLYRVASYCCRTPEFEVPSLCAWLVPKLQRYDATRYYFLFT